MAWELPLPDAFGWTNLVAGGAMLALAVVLLAFAAGARLHRVLALFLALRGAMNVLEAYGGLGGGAASPSARVHVYFDIAVAFATIAFALVFRRRYGPAPPKPVHEGAWLALLAVLAFVSIALYVVDDSLFFGEGIAPLSAFAPMRVILYSLVAFILALDARASVDASRREASSLVALGFALTPLHFSPPPGVVSGVVAEGGVRLLGMGVLIAIPTALAAASVVSIAQAARAAGRVSAAHRTLGVAALAFLSAVLVVALIVVSPQAGVPLYRVFDGIWTLSLPLLVAYAILRHRLFDLDVRIRWTVSRTTLAALFVAVFFVASEVASQIFQSYTGSAVVGIFAAGLLVFALTPLQHFAERVGRAAVPRATPTTALSSEERAEFYREQARLAWADGMLTRDERRMLDATRARLGLSLDEAARIEGESSASE